MQNSLIASCSDVTICARNVRIRRNSRNANVLRIVSSIWVVLLLGSLSYSQNNSRNDTTYNADKTLRSNARVNPSTLAMEFSLPLPSYPGRAGSSLPNVLSYSSKVWSNGETAHYTTSSGQKTSVPTIFAQRSAAGWTNTLGVPQISMDVKAYTEGGLSWMYDAELDSGSDFNISYVHRVRLLMPDGSVHEMRMDDGSHPYGTALSPGYGTSGPDGIYLSVDNSKLRLVIDGGDSVLYMPDGSRFVDLPQNNYGYVSYGTTKYYDASGNKMVYTVASGAGAWTDSMGRSIVDPLPRFGDDFSQPTASTPTFTYPTISGGTSQNIQFTWESLSTQQSTLVYITNVICSGPTTTLIPSGYGYMFTSPGGNERLCGWSTTFDPVVLTALTLPNGAKYSFHYNVYGEMDQINYPTGGYERFVYAQAAPIGALGNTTYDQLNRIVTDRYVSPDGTSGSEIHWQYAVQKETTSPYLYHVKTYAPDGTWSEQLLGNGSTSGGFGFTPQLGLPNETRVYDNTTSNNLLRRSLISYTYTGGLTIGGVSPESGAYRDVRPDREVSMIFEGGSSNALVTMTETVYDTSGSSDPAYFSSLNAKQVKKYNYVVQTASTAASASLSTATGWFSSSDVAVVQESDYLYDSNYLERNLTSLPTETRVKDVSGNVKAKTQYSYDETTYVTTSSGTMPSGASGTWLDPTGSGTDQLGSTIGAKRGMPTTVKSYYDISNGYYITTHNFFDQYGNLVKTRDGRGNDITTEFADTYAFAYPTKVTTPVPDSTGTNGSNAGFETTSTYDYNTGLVINVTDPNSLVTKHEYADDLLRPTKITPTDGTSAVGGETRFVYGAPSSGVYASSQRFVETRTQIDSTNWKESYAWSDGLGRAIMSQTIDTNGDVFALTCYDSMGRVLKSSSPFRGVSSPSCSSTTGVDWTIPAYDELGRTVSTTTPDSAVVSFSYGISSSSPVGTTKVVTDQAGKKRKGITDALGRMTRIVEDPDTAAYATDYTFDTLGNLRKTAQGSQYRYFMYDDLSRVTYARQVEQTANSAFSGSSYTDPVTSNNQWSVKYVYDANGNITSTTDANNVSVSASYDNLNRIYLRDYSDSTPDVSFYYDGKGLSSTPAYSKGKTTKVTSTSSENRYLIFDRLGHVLTARQTTGSTNYDTTYTYSLSGALLEETYPSGRMVKNTIDANGDLSAVDSKPAGGSYTARANTFVYNAAGAATSFKLGNNKYENFTYNNRQQVTQIGLGTSVSDTSLLNLEYKYNTTGYTDNNGSMLEQKITVPTVGGNAGFVATQTYAYDALNRLSSATENLIPSGGSSTQTWKQELSYDRYGNRSFVTGTGHTTSFGACTTTCNPTYDTATNRYSASQGFSYDADGSLTVDATGQQYVVDAENRQTEVKSASSVTQALYGYDGEGRRIKKTESASGNVITFLYDTNGVLIEESNQAPVTYADGEPILSLPAVTSYVYAGSRLVSTETSSGTSYVTVDHLGSTRVTTNSSGNVTARKDFLPFGDEILTSQRISGLGYNPPTVRKDYTGYEKESESGLEFAQARFYNPGRGRFTSVDPINQSARTGNPQTFNRYSYVSNDPINFLDPTGASECSAEFSYEECGGDSAFWGGGRFWR